MQCYLLTAGSWAQSSVKQLPPPKSKEALLNLKLAQAKSGIFAHACNSQNGVITYLKIEAMIYLNNFLLIRIYMLFGAIEIFIA